METILPYLLNTLLGAGGGWLGNMLKKNGLGTVGNLIAGAVGGNALPLIIGMLMNKGTEAAATGGFDIMGLITALVGGGAGSLIGGLFKRLKRSKNYLKSPSKFLGRALFYTIRNLDTSIISFSLFFKSTNSLID